ncbi:MAG TPA: adenosylcobinamide-GDP ribazoletransferase [Planctomycetota bacterium]|jgi:adenosylcobinamide-GDP ribazoletransferase
MRSVARSLAFLSVLPFGRLGHFESRDIPAMVAVFPLAGAVLGALLGLIFHGLLLTFQPAVACALTVCIWVGLTRSLHLDGLADCVDGLGGSYTREGRLKIMKDPHIGTFGVVAVVCALLLKYSALTVLANSAALSATAASLASLEGLLGSLGDPSASGAAPSLPAVLAQQATADLPHRVLMLALVCSTARLSILIVSFRSTYARAEGGLGRDFVAAASAWSLAAGALIPLALAIAVGWVRGLPALAAGITSALAVRYLFTRALGGQTGDTLGASVELSEIAGLLAPVF